ncbi:MAG: hypothetical protein HUJ67_04175 [Ruminiclostridium sp.]|nr:hypothetical protein [Ruminiclostridium sp.]
MYAAVFEIKTRFGKEKYLFEGTSAANLLSQFEEYQDLECLVSMGQMQEKGKGLQELKKLEDLLDKRGSCNLSMADLEQFAIKISLGTIKCTGTAEGEEAILALRKRHPDAM